MTIVPPLSAFAVIRVFSSSIIFICFRLYWWHLWNVLYIFVSVICLIFLVARYLNVFYILMSKCLITFFVSIISMLFIQHT